MPDQDFDLIIIGAGIVGLATALEATRRFPGIRLAVLEKEDRVAAHQTGHNSGVIHSGLYYRPGSLKAKLCVEGAQAMVRFCREHALPHNICGKVVVATSAAEIPALEELHRRGTANGVPGLETIGPERLREIEPHAAGVRALWVPTTGITDFAAVARKYVELIEAAGGKVLVAAKVVGIRRAEGTVVETRAGAFQAKTVVNCAGLYSDRIALMAGADPGVRIIPFRGEYYQLAESRRDLVRGLIYPVPDPALPFLGVHFTLRVDGSVEAGPNAVLALRREGYRKTDFSARELASALAFPGFWKMAKRLWRSGAGEYYRSLSKAAFTRALQKLVPEIRKEDLSPGGSGVRAQAVDTNGKLVDDFCFVRSEGMVHVLNVPSPAATASLVIGREIVANTQQREILPRNE
ncbi:MAG TPA: L-2-hydroxyglutarate oxidase [Terriglobales bacterium]